jgi:hypothetical protein
VEEEMKTKKPHPPSLSPHPPSAPSPKRRREKEMEFVLREARLLCIVSN